MTINEHLTKELIRERTQPRVRTQRPPHPRAVRALRRLADRIEGDH
ncbi:MAG: hypothetical protein H0T14_06480 [Nocardioidaceae bacterium]|nr:hypothetical protein [Nocardioidaceae bacterium]